MGVHRKQAHSHILRGLGRVLIAFSGGTDSALLLKAAADALPAGDVLAVTAVSPILSRREKADAVHLARQIGVRHLLFESGEMKDPEFTVGVAGLHRLLSVREDLFRARIVVVIAGMEGALASVIGGLVACPVIGVPTSVGCGAGYQASLINKMVSAAEEGTGG